MLLKHNPLHVSYSVVEEVEVAQCVAALQSGRPPLRQEGLIVIWIMDQDQMRRSQVQSDHGK